MITLKKDNVVMRVATELQASVFLRNGYVRVVEEPVAEKKVEEVPAEQPKKRTRRAKSAE